MIDTGKVDVIGVRVDAVDYDAAVARIIDAAVEPRPYRVSALAVHGVKTGVDDPEHLARLNAFDLITPDGQPVRWAMNWLHGTGLPDRVYGPDLTFAVCRAAFEHDLGVYFHGSTPDTLDHLVRRLPTLVPGIRIVGTSPSSFDTSTPDELDEPGGENSRHRRGDLFRRTRLPTPGQRLMADPRRLRRRYVILNPRYAGRMLAQRMGRHRSPADGDHDAREPVEAEHVAVVGHRERGGRRHRRLDAVEHETGSGGTRHRTSPRHPRRIRRSHRRTEVPCRQQHHRHRRVSATECRRN